MCAYNCTRKSDYKNNSLDAIRIRNTNLLDVRRYSANCYLVRSIQHTIPLYVGSLYTS